MPVHVGTMYVSALVSRGHEGARCCVLKAWLIEDGPYLEVREMPLTLADIQKRSN